MKRAQKKEAVSFLREKINSSNSVIVVRPKGLTVEESTKLRRGLGKKAKIKVTKNTLTKLAIQGTEYESLLPLFSGPTAIIFSEDSVAGAKGIVDFVKKGNQDKIEILGGVIDKNYVDVKSVNAIADLPSLDELRAKIIGVINAPATKIAGVLKAPSEQLVRVLSAYATKE